MCACVCVCARVCARMCHLNTSCVCARTGTLTHAHIYSNLTWPWLTTVSTKANFFHTSRQPSAAVAGIDTDNKLESKPQLWGHDIDWLCLITSDLGRLPVCAAAGATWQNARSYMHHYASAIEHERAANKQLGLLRRRALEAKTSDAFAHTAQLAAAGARSRAAPSAMPVLRSAPVLQTSLSSFVRGQLKGVYASYFPMEDEGPGDQRRCAPAGEEAAVVQEVAVTDEEAEGREAHAFVLDSAASAMLLLHDKHAAAAALDVANVTSTRMYDTLHLSLLLPHQPLAAEFASLGIVEPHWLACVAYLCVERWCDLRARVTQWAQRARAVCLVRLHVRTGRGGVEGKGVEGVGDDAWRAGEALDVKAMERVLAHKATLVSEVRDFAAMADAVCAKLEAAHLKSQRSLQASVRASVRAAQPPGSEPLALSREDHPSQHGVVIQDCWLEDDKCVDLSLRAAFFWRRFDPCGQLAALRAVLEHVVEVQSSFGIDRSAAHPCSHQQRQQSFLSSHKAITCMLRGSLSRFFTAWRRRVFGSGARKKEGKKGTRVMPRG